MNERLPWDPGFRKCIQALVASTPDRKLGSGDEENPASHARARVDRSEVEVLLATWPEVAQAAAARMMQRYGPPHEATRTKLFWFGNGPWKRTVLGRELRSRPGAAAQGLFLTQYIDYPLRPEQAHQLQGFSSNLLMDLACGEVGARHACEAANLAALNLMHAILSGTIGVEEANGLHRKALAAHALGHVLPCTRQLLFPLRGAGRGAR